MVIKILMMVAARVSITEIAASSFYQESTLNKPKFELITGVIGQDGACLATNS